MCNVIDGKAVSAASRIKVKKDAELFYAKYGRKPSLAVILVGNDPASETYVANKIKGCEEAGIRSVSYRKPQTSTDSDIADIIASLACDDNIDGILVQLPLPKHLNEKYLLSLIPDEKDVDGFSPRNIGALAMGNPLTVSCTPLGVMELLASTGISLTGKKAVVIGRSNTVGKPMAMLLLNADCTVTVCHSKTQNLAEISSEADIVVACIGKPLFVGADMVKDGAIVIDVGINRVDGKLKGDVDYENVRHKCSFITPVPGGVGPMTIAMLLSNTVRAANGRKNG